MIGEHEDFPVSGEKPPVGKIEFAPDYKSDIPKLPIPSVFSSVADPRAEFAVDALKRLRECEAALYWLLMDSQHKEHNCGDPACPVDGARNYFAKWKP